MALLLPALLACHSPSQKPAQAQARPNILLVTLDTTRADALACYGNTAASTPNLDRIAEEGTRFSRAFTVTPLTIPAHASLLTGLYPPSHGVRDNGDFFLGPDALTLAEQLRGAGYATGAAVGAEVTSHHWGFAQGFDDYFDDMGDATAPNRWRVERSGDHVVDDALGWLYGQDEPWLAWVHLFDAHSPYAPPEPYASRFPEQPYLGEIAFADAQLGRLLAAVDLSRTWVLVMADHGEGMGAHGELLHGVLLYNATVRIPLIARPPGGTDARYVHFPVSLVDVTPTVLAITGTAPGGPMDGIDLSPWMGPDAPPEAPARGAVYIESLYAWRHYGWASQRALVAADQKLIDSTTPELYARADYAERHNLAGQAPAAVAALQAALQERHAQAAPVAPSTGALGAKQRAQLAALGYMSAATGAEGDGFGAGLADPVDRLPILRSVEASRQALQGGDLDGALQLLDAVLDEEPGLIAARQLRAHVLQERGQIDDALAELAALHAENPSAPVEISMALLQLDQGDLKAGLALLRAALEREPYLDGAWQPYLRALFSTGHPDLTAALATARERGAARSTVAVLGAASAAQAGEHGAEAALEAALAAWPDEPMGRTVLAARRRAAGDPVRAEQLLLDEITLQPAAPQPRLMLIELMAEQRRYAEQLAALDGLLEQAPPTALLLHARAQALFNLDRFAESLDDCARCMALDPGAALCRLLAANALQALGRTEEARQAYAEARALAGLPPE